MVRTRCSANGPSLAQDYGRLFDHTNAAGGGWSLSAFWLLARCLGRLKGIILRVRLPSQSARPRSPPVAASKGGVRRNFTETATRLAISHSRWGPSWSAWQRYNSFRLRWLLFKKGPLPSAALDRLTRAASAGLLSLAWRVASKNVSLESLRGFPKGVPRCVTSAFTTSNHGLRK